MVSSDTKMADPDERIFIGKGEQPAWLTLGLANRPGLRSITQRSGRSMRIQILDLTRLDAGIVESQLHHPAHSAPILWWSVGVVGIAVRSIANELGENRSAALDRSVNVHALDGRRRSESVISPSTAVRVPVTPREPPGHVARAHWSGRRRTRCAAYFSASCP